MNGIILPYTIKLLFPEIRGIFMGGCGNSDTHPYGNDLGIYIGGALRAAHTHMCPEDPLYHYLCFAKDLVFNSDGSPSDLLYHEYGHVLHDRSKDIVKCYKYNNLHEIAGGVSAWEEKEHGEEWQNIMLAIGKPHLASPYCSPPY